MAAVPMLPAGPKDCEQRLEYLNGRGGIELKTGLVSQGDWARKTAQAVKSWGGPVTWHVPEEWTACLGFQDFDIGDLKNKVSLIKPLIDEGLIDGVVFHCGAMRWVETFDSSEADTERYASRYACSEILSQIETLVKNFRVLTDYFGPERILIENTPLSMFCEVFHDIGGEQVLVGMENFLGPQLGTPDTVLYLSRMTGAGVVLDAGHFAEFWSLVNRQGDYNFLPRFYIDYMKPEEIEFCRITGYINRRGGVPLVVKGCSRDLLWYIQHVPIRYFHIDAARSSFYKGKPDCERPVLTPEDASVICLDEIIEVVQANSNCLGLLVENVGSDVWPFASERPTDWEGKRRTFEFLETAIGR